MASNMKAVKLRMKSIESTRQITKAMELVAASKLRRAKERADATLPGFKILRDTLIDIASGNTDFSSVYTKPSKKSDRWCYVVIAGDRGLAGGYNSNLFKTVAALSADKDYMVIPIGKKAQEYYVRNGVEIINDTYKSVEDLSISDCFEISGYICDQFRKGTFGHVVLCYTEFENMLTMTSKSISMLPLSDFVSEEEGHAVKNVIEYMPTPEEVFDSIVPEYLTSIIYDGLCESFASELAARRTAMDSATKNAEDMLKELELNYNRARQASITQEITEIVAGASV